MLDTASVNHAAFSYYTPLRRVKEYIDENYREKISLATIARVAGLESKYFSAFFRAKTGVCFKDWIAHVRISQAVELMKRQDDTITNIAFAVGFRDLRTFERAFKKCLAMTPQAFKRSIRPC